jgi:hypothetical protein
MGTYHDGYEVILIARGPIYLDCDTSSGMKFLERLLVGCID